MAEYIDREALKNDIAKSTEPFNTGSVFRAINRQIAADVAPVVHGHFVHDGPRFAHGVDWWHCSNCGRLASGVETRFDYCPWCGARMDGDESEAR